MRRLLILGLCLLILTGVVPVLAQDATAEATSAASTPVSIPATDGLTLVGELWTPDVTGPTPAVLLLHQVDGTRAQWTPLIPSLLEAGYRVVAVDLRGLGETGGEINWKAATGDVQTWLDWMRQQPDVRANAISVIGASVGSNLALIGCANDQQCVTAIALSPGLNYFGLRPEKSVIGPPLSNRGVLIVASQNDPQSAAALREWARMSTGNIVTRMYSGPRHGVEIFDNSHSLVKLILYWLDVETPLG